MAGSLVVFFSLTFLVSWIFWTAAVIVSRAVGSAPFGLENHPLLLLGVFAPSLVALALTARAEGRAGTRVLLERVVQAQASVPLYVFAVGYMAAIKLAAAVLLRIGTGAWPAFGEEPLYIMAMAMIVSTPVQAGEEIGWRGYALPRLARGLGLPLASLVLGVIWASWHLPFFFISGTDKSGQSFLVYLLGTTALSVAMAWLYWRANESLLLTMLMHAAINNTKDIVPSVAVTSTSPFTLNASLVAWLTAALLWIPAVYMLLQMRGAKLQST